MPPGEPGASPHPSPLRAAARAAWIFAAVASTIKVLVSPDQHTLWLVFRKGALGWWAGENIYVNRTDYFNYSPAFAALVAPFVALGVAGNVLFNVAGLALLYFAICRLVRTVFPEPVLSRAEAAVLLLSLVGVLRSLWSSQAHTWTAAFLFLAAAAIVERRWWAAALALGLSVHLKLAPIALAAVVAVVWPAAMAWRLPLAILAIAAVPFLRGHPAEVLAMYPQWRDWLEKFSQIRFPSFRDARHLFEIAGVATPLGAYRALQGAALLAVAFWAWRLARRGVETRWLVSGAFALTTVYLLVLGPAVEFTQYPALAPWVSAAWLAAWPRPRERWLLGAIWALTMVAGFGAVEDVFVGLFASRLPEAAITLGTAAFGAWIVWAWRKAPAEPAPETP